MRGLEIQLRTRSKVIQTRAGHALSFTFPMGPIQVFIIAHLPEPERRRLEGPLVYVKINLRTDDQWQVYRDHSAPIKDLRDAGEQHSVIDHSVEHSQDDEEIDWGDKR
jgi:hypothetical protein